MLPNSLEYLECGAVGDYVQVLQKVLNLYQTTGTPLTPDGKFGPKTEAAVKRFQARYALTADGIVGPKTRAKLFALGTHQSLCCLTRRADTERGGLQVNFAMPGNVLGQLAGAGAASAPVRTAPAASSSSITMPVAAMPPSGSLSVDDIPGFNEPLPFPNILGQLPPLQLPSLPPLTLPSFFPKKLQLGPGVQRSVPKLTLFGPPPKTNNVVDTFVFTVRGAWPITHGGQFQAGGALALPITQPISDPKNTTFQVFAQGVSPDLLISYKSWVHLFLIGKASVTVSKDGSTTSGALSPQFKASFDLSKDGSLSFSVVGGPQLAGTSSSSGFSVTVTPFVGSAGFTLSTP